MFLCDSDDPVNGWDFDHITFESKGKTKKDNFFCDTRFYFHFHLKAFI